MRSLSLGFLGGVLMISDLRVTTKNTHLQIDKVAILLRYWLTQPRVETAPTPSTSTGGPAAQLDPGLSPRKARLEANLKGVNYIVMNNR